MIVVDASVVVSALAGADDEGPVAVRRIMNEQALAPHLIDIEVAHALRSMNRRGDISVAEAQRGLRNLADLRIMRIDHKVLLERCWELRHNLTAYDASYVALAEYTGATLLTGDGRLARASGIDCEVEIFDPAG
ncbi:type II toxin-antitoxin system VapC family toxin [Candidatus Poriferisodalis sp.]|uniref:type II toxin-antitoxin system VapC family toxin n=1 Tax=Candidatus Poriferisodalis sp. TaxID=3101277 RepID=UPI003B018891